MSTKTILPWFAINEIMEEDYRKTVVEIALAHLPRASKELQAFAKNHLNKFIVIPGFRAFDKVKSVKAAQPFVVNQMSRHPFVTDVVIALWGEAMTETSAILRHSAQAQGMKFQAAWGWQDALNGYYPYGQIPEFDKICQELAKGKPSPECDHLMLAELWLSGALIETESATNIATETNLATAHKIDAPVEIETETISSPVEDTLVGTTLETLSAQLRQSIGNTEKSHQAARAQIQQATRALEAFQAEQAKQDTAAIVGKIQTWLEQQTQLQKIVPRAVELLKAEGLLRQDLTLDLPQHETLQHAPSDQNLLVIAAQVQNLFERVQEYDRQKQSAWLALEETHQRIAILCARLVNLGITANADWDAPVAVQLDQTATLAELRSAVEATHVIATQVEQVATQWRDTFESNIQTLIQKLQTLGALVEDPPTQNATLEELSDLSKRLEQKLADETARAKAIALPTLVSDLRKGWTSPTLTLVLQQLARSTRDLEAVLLLLTSNLAQPRTDPLELDQPVVDSLLNGIDEAGGENAFEFLNQIALNFQNGWQPVGLNAQVGLAIAYIGAQYAAGQSLPAGFLWEITQEWPLRGMASWEKLWQAAVRGDALPLLYSKTSLSVASLQKTRTRAEQMLERKSGLFVCLHALKHNRHKALLSAEFLPELAQRLAELQQIQNDLADAPTTKISKLDKKLQDLASGATSDLLGADKLETRYQTKAIAEGIDDAAPFHLRSATNLLQDCAKAVAEYQHALANYTQVKLGFANGVCVETLQAELNKVPEYQARGGRMLARLQRNTARQENRDETQTWAKATRRLTEQLLSEPTCSLRLPRLVAKLIQVPLNLPELAGSLLDDLCDAPNPDQAATWLLEAGASNQVLMHVQQISLDLQKRAQMIKTEKEHQTATLQTELLKLGGAVDDLIPDRTLGRWGYLTQELERRLEIERAKRAQEGQRKQERLRAMLSEINKLEDAILQASAMIPPDICGLFNQGLDLARKLTRTATELEGVDTFLKELRYRFEHQSWAFTDLQEALAHLERAARGETPSSTHEFSSAQILAFLEREESTPLGLGTLVTSSEMGTRADLLQNWLRLEKMTGFLATELSIADRHAIKALYRYFAQMVKMKRALGVNDASLEFDDPVVFAHYELQIPKADVLKSNCIMIAMPGKPVRADHLKGLEYLIDEKKWLDDSFILLFMPGCTEGNRKRLESHYRQKLVIIDDRALLDMILAEARGKNPLGRLRSLMIHACGVENVEVFRFNQRVNPHTAIFVGRESLIDKVVNSDGSFALYGGRRIGKSSILMEIQSQLEQRGTVTVHHSFEGEEDCSDDASARKLARKLKTEIAVNGIGEFKVAIQNYMERFPGDNLVIFLDEIDRYIEENRRRHILIEALRSLADQYAGHFRVVVAGFMRLYECLDGRGPYTPTSDPWQRMFNKDKPVKNVRAVSAEKIAREGFLDILDWEFANRGIPQLIVERTGCHPAFVQRFCDILQSRVALRGDRVIRVEDVEAVFNDQNPTHSFIAYVRNTLEMNLDPISRYLILWLAAESQANSFTLDLAKSIAQMCKTTIPESQLLQSLDHLKVTSVVEERSVGVYEFSVPDYPVILQRLGDTKHIEQLEIEIPEYLKKNGHAN